MGGLNPGSGAALRKEAMPGAGSAWCKGSVGDSPEAMASAAEEQTMQEAQVGQSGSGATAWASCAAKGAGVLTVPWCSAQSGSASATDPMTGVPFMVPWCAGTPCCPAMEIAITSAARPRKGVNRIIRMTSQRRMHG